MSPAGLALIFFFYGLAFFSMGLAITLEMGHGSDLRLRHALRPLAVFGLVHGTHEWMEMFQGLGLLSWLQLAPLAWEALRVGILALSFLSLGAFGASLLSPTERLRRLSLSVPIGQACLWGIGLMFLKGRFPSQAELWVVADVWTRYVLAIPSALLATAGLVIQHRAFREAGMAQFGRDSLFAAGAFAMYGVVGQLFTRTSPLPPSTVINQDLFLAVVGFPVQLLRAMAAIVVAFSVTRFLRSREVETQRQIAALQAARLEEAQRREALRGELFKRIVAAQEAERQRIARELHDETGQALTAIGMGLRGAVSLLRQDERKTADNLRQLEGLAAHSLDELQRLISDLRPSHLDDLGLPAALRWYAGEIQSRSSLEISVEILSEPRPIPSSISTALFRVAQEALTNVVKHADASFALVCLEFGPEVVRLSIDDNGRGFDTSPMASPDRTSWGLLGMKERASLLGGLMRLTSEPGKGTRVEVEIPYDEKTGVSNGDSSIAG